jgi:hypothetical protein
MLKIREALSCWLYYIMYLGFKTNPGSGGHRGRKREGGICLIINIHA